MGTYDGHGGAVWCLDVDWQTKNFLSGAADNTIRLWDVENGIMLNRIDTKSIQHDTILDIPKANGVIDSSGQKVFGLPVNT